MKTTIPANSENVINITIDKGCIIRYSLCFFKCIHFYIYGPPVQSSNPSSHLTQVGTPSGWLGPVASVAVVGPVGPASCHQELVVEFILHSLILLTFSKHLKGLCECFSRGIFCPFTLFHLSDGWCYRILERARKRIPHRNLCFRIGLYHK